ncbi:tetratricopeptide repeat protein [Algoriphagus sp. CAU 1675]|uniref:tetratricopeptide repeat protein n=1 Tax=Algoriphagus sp. CAU 1675 TaxID=3032597 RepID=UPI0023DB876F|nr:tetratricopeptide repeat protein [Algoriphagus sp. CAU 1675]MDF2156272.1 tetratricopeptide repeat protein [Algoriphagus sp. CAU 1675]
MKKLLPVFQICLFLYSFSVNGQDQAKFNELDLGLQSFNSEEYGTALIHFDAWTRENPNDPMGYWYKGQCYEAFGGEELVMALENYSIALTLNPEITPIYLNKGRVLYLLKRFEEAEQNFNTYLKLPKGETTQVIYRKSSTGTGISGIFTDQTENPSHIYYQIGLCRMGLEDFEAAVSFLDSAIFYSPNEADYHAEQGKALMELGRNQEALENLKRAIELDPNHYLAIQRILLIEKGGDSENLEALTLAISNDPENPEVWNLRGYYKLTHEDAVGAIQDFSEAISLNPELPESWMYRAKANASVKNWPKAESDFSEALILDEYNPELFLGRGQTRYYQSENLLALADFMQMIILDPGNPSGYYHRGITLHRLNRFEEACQDLKKAYEMGMREAMAVFEKICSD